MNTRTVKNYELRVAPVQVSDEALLYRTRLTGPGEIEKLAHQLIGDAAQESVIVFLLDRRGRLLGYTEAARGAIDSCTVDMRVVFRAAVVVGASAIVVAHNHPSGDPRPSSDDLALTIRVGECARLLGVELLDHVIVSPSHVLSFKERGLL